MLDRVRDEPHVIFQFDRVFDDLLIGKDVDGDVNLRIFLPEKVDDKGEVVSAEALARMDPEAAAFSLLKVAETLLSLTFELKDFIRKIIEDFSGIGGDHLFAESV